MCLNRNGRRKKAILWEIGWIWKQLPQKCDREKFVLSSEKYNLILECLNTEKGIKAPGGARFKNWEKSYL